MKHAEWMDLAEAEYERLLDLLRDLEPDDWRRPTDCTAWDVREMVAHLVGAAESGASFRESMRQQRLGKPLAQGRPLVDGINDVQVAERADRTPGQLVADLEDAAGRGVRARRRLPALVRALPVPFGPPLGTRPLGYLMDCIYTRDAWLHRVDICRAVGREPVLTSDHDGRIVADVVHEWARAHGQPFRLELTGAAGGSFGGSAGEVLEVDAVEFCRTLSGRAPGAGLLSQEVPF